MHFMTMLPAARWLSDLKCAPNAFLMFLHTAQGETGSAFHSSSFKEAALACKVRWLQIFEADCLLSAQHMVLNIRLLPR